MKKFGIAFAAFVAVAGFGLVAKAAPIGTTLTLTTDSSLTVFVSTLGGATTGALTTAASGTADVTFDDAAPPSSTIEITDAEVDLADGSIFLDLSLFGGVEAALIGAGINTLTTDAAALTETAPLGNPFTSTFDPGAGTGLTASIDEGALTYNGTGALGGILGMGTFDFATDPLSFSLGSVGQIGLVTQSQSGTLVDVTVSVPVSFSDQIATDPVTIDVVVSGQLILTGSYIIPEPSTLVLLGLAGLGLVPVWRRIRK